MRVKRVKCPNQNLAPYWQNSLVEIPKDSPIFTESSTPLEQQPLKVWCNNFCMVMLYPAKDNVLRLTIRLHDHRNGVLDFDALDSIKNDCGFSKYQAFEVYPDKADMVNACNLRHLWIMPLDTKLDIGWIRNTQDKVVINPFELQSELKISHEQLDVFIQGGQWSSVTKHGYPKDERKKYVVLYHFHNETHHNMFIVRYSSLTGFAVPNGAIVTHYHSVLELPKELIVTPTKKA